MSQQKQRQRKSRSSAPGTLRSMLWGRQQDEIVEMQQGEAEEEGGTDRSSRRRHTLGSRSSSSSVNRRRITSSPSGMASLFSVWRERSALLADDTVLHAEDVLFDDENGGDDADVDGFDVVHGTQSSQDKSPLRGDHVLRTPDRMQNDDDEDDPLLDVMTTPKDPTVDSVRHQSEVESLLPKGLQSAVKRRRKKIQDVLGTPPPDMSQDSVDYNPLLLDDGEEDNDKYDTIVWESGSPGKKDERRVSHSGERRDARRRSKGKERISSRSVKSSSEEDHHVGQQEEQDEDLGHEKETTVNELAPRKKQDVEDEMALTALMMMDDEEGERELDYEDNVSEVLDAEIHEDVETGSQPDSENMEHYKAVRDRVKQMLDANSLSMHSSLQEMAALIKGDRGRLRPIRCIPSNPLARICKEIALELINNDLDEMLEPVESASDKRRTKQREYIVKSEFLETAQQSLSESSDSPVFKEIRMTKNAFALLHEVVEHEMANLFFVGNILALTHSRQTVYAHDLRLATLITGITDQKLHIHTDYPLDRLLWQYGAKYRTRVPSVYKDKKRRNYFLDDVSQLNHFNRMMLMAEEENNEGAKSTRKRKIAEDTDEDQDWEYHEDDDISEDDDNVIKIKKSKIRNSDSRSDRSAKRKKTSTTDTNSSQ